MFHHRRIENTDCYSCKETKQNCVLIMVPARSSNVIFVICNECLENLLGDSKPEEVFLPKNAFQIPEHWEAFPLI